MTTARELLQEALKRTRAELLERAEREEQEVRVPRNPSQEWFDRVANALHISDADVKAMHDAFLYAAQPEPDGGVLEGTNRTTSGAIGQP